MIQFHTMNLPALVIKKTLFIFKNITQSVVSVNAYFLLAAILHLNQFIGIGPHDTLITSDGWYYEKKATLLHNWAVKMNCEEEEQVHLCSQLLS